MALIPPKLHPLRPSGRCLVRAARPEDAAGVLECARDVFSTSPHTLTQADEFVISPEEERAFIADKLAAVNELFLIVLDAAHADAEGSLRSESSEPVLGILDLKPPAKRRKVRHVTELGMSVRSTHRGRGVGHALLASAIAWAEANPSLELMTLAVYADNAAGLALYRRLGFVEYGRLPGGCKHDDGSRWDQVYMRRPLKG
jgi:ribosomal protein S18 acetylase RimI-like enzyme